MPSPRGALPVPHEGRQLDVGSYNLPSSRRRTQSVPPRPTSPLMQSISHSLERRFIAETRRRNIAEGANERMRVEHQHIKNLIEQRLIKEAGSLIGADSAAKPSPHAADILELLRAISKISGRAARGAGGVGMGHPMTLSPSDPSPLPSASPPVVERVGATPCIDDVGTPALFSNHLTRAAAYPAPAIRRSLHLETSISPNIDKKRSVVIGGEISERRGRDEEDDSDARRRSISPLALT